MKSLAGFLWLTCSLLVAGPAGAESWSKRLTPEKPDDNFNIKIERLKDADVGEFLQFRITVKLYNLSDIKETPRRSHVLRVFNGKEFISSCEVQPTRQKKGEQVFSFRVAVKYADKSMFSYTLSSDFDSIGYWFYLKDFVESK